MNRKSKITDKLLQAVYQKTRTQPYSVSIPAIGQKSLYEEVMSLVEKKVPSSKTFSRKLLKEAADNRPTKITEVPFRLDKNKKRRYVKLTEPIGDTGISQELFIELINYNSEQNAPLEGSDEARFNVLLKKGTSAGMSPDINNSDILPRGSAIKVTGREVESILEKFYNYIDSTKKPKSSDTVKSGPENTQRNTNLVSTTEEESKPEIIVVNPKLDDVEVRFVSHMNSSPMTSRGPQKRDKEGNFKIPKLMLQPSQAQFDSLSLHDHLITKDEFDQLLKYTTKGSIYSLQSGKSATEIHTKVKLSRYVTTEKDGVVLGRSERTGRDIILPKGKVLAPVDDKMKQLYPGGKIPLEMGVGEVLGKQKGPKFIRTIGDKSNDREAFWDLKTLRLYGYGLTPGTKRFLQHREAVAQNAEVMKQRKTKGGAGITIKTSFAEMRDLIGNAIDERDKQGRARTLTDTASLEGLITTVRDTVIRKLQKMNTGELPERTRTIFLSQLQSLRVSPRTVDTVAFTLYQNLISLTERLEE